MARARTRRPGVTVTERPRAAEQPVTTSSGSHQSYPLNFESDNMSNPHSHGPTDQDHCVSADAYAT